MASGMVLSSMPVGEFDSAAYKRKRQDCGICQGGKEDEFSADGSYTAVCIR